MCVFPTPLVKEAVRLALVMVKTDNVSLMSPVFEKYWEERDTIDDLLLRGRVSWRQIVVDKFWKNIFSPSSLSSS